MNIGTGGNTLQQQDTLQNAVDWLAKPISDDPLEEVAPLRLHVRAVLESGKPPLPLLKLLDSFEPRATAIAALARPMLRDATLPLPRQLRSLALALADVHGALAQGFLRVAGDLDSSGLATLRRSRAQICGDAMSHLAAQLQIALLTTSSFPAGLWLAAQRAYQAALTTAAGDLTFTADDTSSERNFKLMLALAAAQPEAMTFWWRYSTATAPASTSAATCRLT
jgi:hypothetical protein